LEAWHPLKPGLAPCGSFMNLHPLDLSVGTIDLVYVLH
jgi:hypothetical protein